MKNIVVARLYPTAVGAVAGGYLTQDIGGKGGGSPIEIIGFNPVCLPTWCPVAMNAYKDCIGVGIGDGGPHTQWYEDIGVPGHDNMVSPTLELGPEASGDIKCEVFLIHAANGMGAMVDSSVAGIDNDGVKIGEIGAWLEKGTPRQCH